MEGVHRKATCEAKNNEIETVLELRIQSHQTMAFLDDFSFLEKSELPKLLIAVPPVQRHVRLAYKP